MTWKKFLTSKVSRKTKAPVGSNFGLVVCILEMQHYREKVKSTEQEKIEWKMIKNRVRRSKDSYIREPMWKQLIGGLWNTFC